MEWPRLDRDEQARARGRLARWEARKEHQASGGRTLTLGELSSLITWTKAEAEAAESEIALAVILLRLDDIEREFHWRTFLGENTTDWPDDPNY